MSEKVIEILVLLMQHMQDEQGHFDDISETAQNLAGQGYTDQDVNAALSWLFDRLQEQSEPVIEVTPPSDRRPVRILHAIEQLIISPEAYGYLLQLRDLDLLDDTQMEIMIERAMLTGARNISLSDMKSIAASVLLNDDSAAWLPLPEVPADMPEPTALN